MVDPASASPVMWPLPLSGFSSGASGANASTSTSAGVLRLPAASVAVTSSSAPCCRPGFAKENLPSGPATVVPVLPSGKVMVTVDPGSAEPVMVSCPLTGRTSGIWGASASTITTVGPLFPPSGLPAIKVTSSPCWSPGFENSKKPSLPTMTCAVVPSGKVMVTVLPGSALPMIGRSPFTGSTWGAAGLVGTEGPPELLPEALLTPAMVAARPAPQRAIRGTPDSFKSAANSGSME